MHCLYGFLEHGVHCLLLETIASMNFYNGQWLIKDFGKPWPSIRFEYVICIFLLLGSIVTLGIDDDYDVRKCLRCLWHLKKKVLLGERLVSPYWTLILAFIIPTLKSRLGDVSSQDFLAFLIVDYPLWDQHSQIAMSSM